MRVHYFALTVAFLVASSAATSTSTESELIAPRLADEESFSTKRLLRTHKTFAAAEKEEEEEERVFGIKLPANLGGIGLSKKAAAAMKSAAIPTKQEAAQISRWLDNGLSPLEVMDAQRLKYPFTKSTVIETLTKAYGDEKLATMIQAGTKVEKTEQFAKDLQTAQFKHWVTENKTPENIYKNVLKVD
ncbi:hypothetical protein PF005_g12447 [Phytophthora fragariae]|uniref:RxLR effector protein n=1 Tax=Phytophthora fragariae TaxID=53985 RepID=A0A6A3XVG3_9STRA|nr:hypothetical protein PF005_g12447 [Phytophthora fragariae]